MRFFLLTALVSWALQIAAQTHYQTVDSIRTADKAAGSLSYEWLRMISDGMGQDISIPVIIAKGAHEGRVLGLTAAIHGNELNGIPIIQNLISSVNLDSLHGTIVAIPGLNPISITQDRRRYVDEEDLNRNFPGKAKGNRSQQFVWQITKKVLPVFDIHIDLHTASFGRENTLYVRADMRDSLIGSIASVIEADILLNSTGVPSTGDAIAATRTMRAEAMLLGIPSITIEYGNPQVYQSDMTSRGVLGISNAMKKMGMLSGQTDPSSYPKTICRKSYWIYVDQGGLLDVPVQLNEQITKGQVIGILKNPFGEILKEYTAPEDGIIIGRSSNPVNMSGGRIIHLGILE